MKARVGLALALAMPLAWAGLLPTQEADPASASDRLCAVSWAPPPVAATLSGCRRAWCTQPSRPPLSAATPTTGTAPSAEQLCLCEMGERRYSYWRGHPGQWKRSRAEVSPMMGPEAFSLSLVPLSGGGATDWLIHQEQAVSNGMGVAYGRLCTWPSHQASPVCRDTEEWGALTAVVQEQGRGTCSLLVGGWRPGREPGQPEGTYATGRVFRWEAGQAGAAGRWVDSGRPTVVRRLTQTFMAERGELAERNRRVLWTQDRAVRALQCPDRKLGDLCQRER